MLRIVSFIFLMVFSAPWLYAAECLDIFPSSPMPHGLLPPDKVFINVPHFSGADGFLANPQTLNLGDGQYQSNAAQQEIFVSSSPASETTARLYIANGVNWVNAQINVDGNPEDLIIIANGSMSISGNDTKINAIIYARGAISLSGNPDDPHDSNSPGGIEINGAVAAEGSISTNARVTINYDEYVINNADFNGMCDNTPVITPEPILDYHFDECSYTGAVGEIIDSTGNFSGRTFNGVERESTGQIQSAVNLSNQRHYIETAVPLPTNYSVSVWFKKPTITSGSRYYILGSMSGGGDLLYLDRNNSWRWGVYNLSGATNGSYSFASLDNSWHHLTLVYNAGQTQLYIDGVLVDTINRSVTGTLKYIGTSYDAVNTNNAQGFRAPLDEFMVFDGPLSASNVDEIYNFQASQFNYDGSIRTPVSCPLLVGLYQFEQNNFNSQIDDTSGNDNHASNIGGQSVAQGKYCRGFDSNGTNTSSQTNNAFSSNVNLVDDVGNMGTISFWFNGNTHWDQGGYNGGERTLFDASLNLGLGVGNKYFALNIMKNGLLRFSFEDDVDGDFFIEEPMISPRSSNTWYYITATWNFNTNQFELYVDGTLRINANRNTSGAIKDLGNVIFGDNSSTYSGNNNGALASNYSANGKFDEVRIYNFVLAQSEITADMNESFGCPTFDHFQIDTIDAQGLTCQADNIIIKACADSACSTLNTDNFNVELLVNGVSNRSLTVSGGSTNISYAYTSIGNAALSLDQAYQCKGSATTPCNVAFSDSGFIFGNTVNTYPVIPIQLSGKPSNEGFKARSLYLQAVKTSDNAASCVAAFPENSNVDVNLSYSCHGDSSDCKNAITLNNSNKSYDVTQLVTERRLRFGADSKAYFSIQYPDAGKLILNAQKFVEVEDDAGNKKILDFKGSSNAYVVRPFAFALDFNNDSNSANAFAQNASESAFKKAGEAFTMTATAVQWQNGQDDNADGVPDNFTAVNGNSVAGHFVAPALDVTHNLLLPNDAGAAPGYLSTETSNSFSGSTVDNSYTYSEVGIIELLANLSSGNYLDACDNGGNVCSDGNIQGQVVNVGRFTPDHFELSIVNDGILASICTGVDPDMPFVYSGQMSDLTATAKGTLQYLTQPQLSITAKSSLCPAGVCSTTKNYRGDFMRLPLSGINRYQVDDGSGTNTKVDFPISDASRYGVDTTNKVRLVATYSNGELIEQVAPLGTLTYRYSVNDHFVYLHEKNSEIPPFTSDINLSLASIIDADLISANDADGDPDALGPILNADTVITFNPAGKEVRFGRAILENSFGPETSNLPQPLHLQYLATTGNYVVNSDDECTVWDSSKIDLNTITLNKNKTSAEGGSGSFVEGSTRDIYLTAPTGNGILQGKVGVEYSIAPWLQYDWDDDGLFTNNPTAVATFGVFRGNDRIIYQREVER
ncbi:MSHA fimbrial biogenesis protein MshQ [Colwellia asteriadis]|uniref:MSHA fimbrial biogenesis protein MshQ n=1 Tax=Colwellia asteriadis TaxID=517723 RepID=A0ABN1L3C0_9GAMM